MARCRATMVEGRGDASGGASSVGELVSDAVHGQQISWIPRVRLELAPDVLDVRVDRTLERVDVRPPDGIEQLSTGEHTSWLARQRDDHLKLRRRQLDRRASTH